MKLTTPEIGIEHRQKVAQELTDAVVRLMTRHRPLDAQDMRKRCTVHFTPYDPTSMAIGGTLMRDRGESDITLEFSDWGMNRRLRRRLVREITPVLANLFNMQEKLDHVNIRFHPYPPDDFAVGGKLLAEIIPAIGRVMKRVVG